MNEGNNSSLFILNLSVDKVDTFWVSGGDQILISKDPYLPSSGIGHSLIPCKEEAKVLHFSI